MSSCQSTAPETTPAPQRLTAEIIDSGFADAHDTYNAISTASDGRIYYVLSSAKVDVPAQMFAYNPAERKTKRLGDLNEASGEQNANAIVQGKSHVNFVEAAGKLYFATHIGYYSIIDGQEKMGVPPPGKKPYPGGHFLAYDTKAGTFENLAIDPKGEGIISFAMDTARKRLYGLTWPVGRFIRYDIPAKQFKDLGPVSMEGENGKGPTFRTICRSLSVDPSDGSVYYSTSDGIIHRYAYASDTIEDIKEDDLRKDYFGLYDPASSGHMGYNWRQTVWYEPEKAIYGVHGNSGYLFKYTVATRQVEVLDRITSQPSKMSGMFDQFSYGYLGFTLGPDGHTIYYLTGGPIYENGRRVRGKDSTAKGEAKGRENLHLITWSIPAKRYTDHGPIYYANGERPNYVNSIAVGKDGAVYCLARVSEKEGARTDLIRIPPVIRP